MTRKHFFLTIACLCALPLLRGQNPNLDFSYGDFTNWKCYISNSGYSNGNTCYDSLKWTLCTRAVDGRHTIMSDIYDVDWHTCNGDTARNELLPLVPDGFRYSARVGNSNCGAEAESIRYPLAVDSSNCWVVVHYAAVLEFKNHAGDKEARFGIRFQDTMGKPLPVGNMELSAKDTALMINCHGVYWTDWNTLGVNLSPWIGQTVEIVIYAADCGLSGHYGYGYAVCECCSPKGNVRYCRNSSSAELSAPLGYHSYRWTDSAGRVLDTVPKIKISNPKTGAVYYCQVGYGQNWTDTLSLQIRQTLITPSILYKRDSLTPFIHLANASVITDGELLNQTWRISRRGAGTEYVCSDSSFDYCFKDTGWYEVQLTVDALNRCSDTCSRWFRVEAFPTDLEVNAFLNPDRDTLWDVHAFCPEVRMVNCGKHDAYMTDVHVELYDGDMNIIGSLSKNVSHIRAGDTLVCRFSDSLHCTDYIGDYYLKAYVCQRFVLDTIKRNDTLLKPLFLNYPEKFELSVRDCEISYFSSGYGAYAAYRWWNVRLTPEYSVKMCASITKSSNFRLDSLRLTAQMLDTAGRVVQSQVMWIPSSQSYEASPTAFQWPNSMGNIQFPETRVPNYTGDFYIRVFFDAHSKDKNHADDTCIVRRQCIKKDVVDVWMKSVRPLLDSAEGMTYNTPVVTIVSTSNVDSWNTPLQVKVLDSNKNLLCYLKDTIPLIPCNNTLVYKMPCDFQVPNYTGYYRLEAGIGPKNDVHPFDNTSASVAYCYKGKKSDVKMLSVRPHMDSVLGKTKIYPIVTMKNAGETDLMNIRFSVTSDSMNIPVAQLEDTISFLAVGDSVTKRLSSIYLVPNYTGDYTLRAAALLPYDENPSDDTISYIGHCYKRADTSDVFVLSVRPSCPDTADGYTLVKPVVRIGRSDNIHSKDCQITVSLRLLDSNRNTKADVFNVVNMSPDDTADVLFLQTIQVPDYDGCYYLIATVKSDWNVVSSNDTMEYKCYCYYRPDTADVEFIWAKPHMDTLEGKNMIYVDAKMRYYTNKGTLPSYVDVSPEVLIYDSAGSLVGYYGGYYSYGFHIKNNETKEERLWQNHYTYLFVPDYDGYYYLEAYIAKDPNCNTVISNDTVIYKAYCTKHHFVDVELVSVRPQVDSAFGHSLNTPVVTVRNVGDLGANNIALSVIVMTSGWKIIASLVDTIPYLAAGDSLVKKFTAFYRTPDYSGTYIMQASHTTYKDEYNGHDDAEYRARCIKHPDSADVRLVYISYPSSDQVLNGGFSFMPEIKVELAGSNYDSVKNLHFIAELYDDKGRFVDSSSVLETQSVWKVGDNMRILFPSLFLPNYPDSCRLKIYYDSRIPDPNHRNDTLEMVVRCSYTVDLEVSKLLHPLKDSVLRGGSIVFPKIRITNYARHDVDTVMVCYQLLNWKKEVWDSVREFVGSVEANDDEDFLLTNGYNVPNYNGYYYIKVWAECAHLDVKSANDTLLVKLNAYRFDTVDVMPVEFVQLADTLWGGSRVSPVLKLINNSAMDLNGLGVWMEAADSAGRVIRAWEERDISIQSGNTIKLQCSQSFVIPNYTGDYRLRAAVSYYPKNYALRVHDTLSRCFQIRHSDTIDVGLAELCYPASAEVLPGNTEVKPQVRVVNRSNVALDGLELTACVYDQAGLLHDSIMGNISEIGSDSQVVFEFPTAYRVPNASGSYSLKVQLIAPAGDVSSKDNQILCQLLSKMNKDVDLQLLSVSLSDTGLLKGDAWVHPIVRVTNLLPNKEVEKVKVFVNAYDSSKLLSSLSGEIARIGITDTVELVFADTFQIPNYTGSFYVKAYLQADWNETDFSNDTLTAAFRCQGTDAVREAVEPVWQLGQNIPNPAGMRTVIPFYLPQEANVTLSVFGVNGQLLFSKEIHAMAGGNVYELDVNNMASGIYYYAMEYKGQRLVKKMQIVK